jgi:hypothetical protein
MRSGLVGEVLDSRDTPGENAGGTRLMAIKKSELGRYSTRPLITETES